MSQISELRQTCRSNQLSQNNNKYPTSQQPLDLRAYHIPTRRLHKLRDFARLVAASLFSQTGGMGSGSWVGSGAGTPVNHVSMGSALSVDVVGSGAGTPVSQVSMGLSGPVDVAEPGSGPEPSPTRHVSGSHDT